MLNCDRQTPKIILDELNWMSVSRRIVLNTLRMAYKLMNDLVPELTLFGETHQRNTRNINKFKLPEMRLEKSKKNAFYEGLKYLNNLLREIKESKNLKALETQCSNYVKMNFPII